MTTISGEVKYFNEKKRFGFLQATGLPDSFFHLADCDFDIAPKIGDRVEFELGASDRGPRAANIRFID
jgi:cold shock protein